MTSSVERAEIRQMGLGPWELVGHMASERWGFGAVAAGQNVYVVGGNDGKRPLASVERLVLGVDGNIARSESLSELRVPRWGVAIAMHGSHLFAIGGNDGESTLRTVERARVLDDGSLSEWQVVGSMLDRRYGAGITVTEGQLYVSGGYAGVGPGTTIPNEYLNGVERALIAEDGTIPRFEPLPAMRSRRGYHTLVAVGSRLYAIGGGNGDTFVPTVERLDLQ